MAAGTMIPLLISDLKTLIPSANPNDRYYLTDTGKEGEFYLEATYNVPPQTPPPDDGAITINSNTLSGKVYRYRRTIEDGLIDVRWFGALGDGSTSDNAAIQAAVDTTEGNTIFFGFPGNASYLIDTSSDITVAGKVLKFRDGNMLTGTGTVNGGIIDAGYRQQIFDTDITVNPSGTTTSMWSVMWYGAKPGIDSIPAITKTIDTLNANNTLPITIFFPRQRYTIDSPIIVAKYNDVASPHQYDQCTIKLMGESGGTNMASGGGTEIVCTATDTFAVGFHLCKSGGIESISITGQYTVPTMSPLDFYTADFSAYGDPACRDSQYSPYAGVVVDPFRANSLPPDGGYPGLSAYYLQAPGNATGSGSTGLVFKDMFVTNFTVGFIASPNGQTQNGEVMTYDHIWVANCKAAFASCQAQEKTNVYKHIVCWGTVHTVFTNQDYGYHIDAGNIIMEKVDIAGPVNRLFNWNCGGWYPSIIKDCYTESLGTFGSFTSGGISATIRDSVFDFVIPDDGQLADPVPYPVFHVDINRDITFSGCSFRMYGTGLPINLSGAGSYERCTFERVPYVYPYEYGTGNGAYAQFRDCPLSFTSGILGCTDMIRASLNQFSAYPVYGSYTLIDGNHERNSSWVQYSISGNDKINYFELIDAATAITIDSNRQYSFTSVAEEYYRLKDPVLLISGADFYFGGTVTDITGSTITVSYCPVNVADGTYDIYSCNTQNLYRFIGDVTASNNQVTDIVDSGLGIIDGSYLFSPEMQGYINITGVSGSTATANKNALITKPGAVFSPKGLKQTFISDNPYAPASAFIPGTMIFKTGDEIIDSSGGVVKKYICTKDGMYAPAGPDTRIAQFSLEMNASSRAAFTSDDSIIIPAGGLIEGIILNATAMMTVTVGTTFGGTDIDAGAPLTAGVSSVIQYLKYTDADFQIYFGAISGGTLTITVILKSV
jgi:hypothetical protein